MVRIAIHQPHYLPWLPYFDKADQVDVFVFLDTAHYQKNGLQNRNRIKTLRGDQWLTVPIHAKARRPIRETALRNDGWGAKHARTIRHHYAKAPCFELFSREIEPILVGEWSVLSDLNVALTRLLFRVLDIRCDVVLASELGVRGERQELLIDICKALGADAYLSGPGAAAYQEPAAFRDEGIELRYQRYTHLRYDQLHPDRGFVPALSALDLVLNAGAESGRIMRAGRWPAEPT